MEKIYEDVVGAHMGIFRTKQSGTELFFGQGWGSKLNNIVKAMIVTKNNVLEMTR